MLEGADLTAERIATEVAEMIAAGDLPGGAEPRVEYELRYAGQAFELSVPGGTEPGPGDLTERFEAAHRERYGHSDPHAAG